MPPRTPGHGRWIAPLIVTLLLTAGGAATSSWVSALILIAFLGLTVVGALSARKRSQLIGGPTPGLWTRGVITRLSAA